MWFDSKTGTAVFDPRKAVLLLLLAAGCVAPPRTVQEPPAAPAAVTPAPTPEATPEPTPEATPEPTPEATPTPAEAAQPPEISDRVIVLDSGGEPEGSTQSLVEAARAERERRAHAGPSTVVITDKNLKQYATGKLTVASPKAGAGKAEPSPEGDLARDEQYWRGRALETRQRWRHAADDVKELETTTAGWRRRFYAENDPRVRDGQIKPEWDRALDRLSEARAEVEAAKKDLADLLEEGRMAGAFPGWLREGVDQEPKEEPEPSKTHQAIDPPRAPEPGSPP